MAVSEQLAAPIDTAGYIRMRPAMRLTGWSYSRIQRYAYLGDIRSLKPEGKTPLYHAIDLTQLKAREEQRLRA